MPKFNLGTREAEVSHGGLQRTEEVKAMETQIPDRAARRLVSGLRNGVA